MTDRELLELAAKAAGITRHDWVGIGYQEQRVHGVPHCGTEGPIWNPLNDDGDAFRLAVKLRIAITYPFDENCVRCWHGHEGTEPVCIYLGDDPYAATRRAVVNAAAEIGKAMK